MYLVMCNVIVIFSFWNQSKVKPICFLGLAETQQHNLPPGSSVGNRNIVIYQLNIRQGFITRASPGNVNKRGSPDRADRAENDYALWRSTLK